MGLISRRSLDESPNCGFAVGGIASPGVRLWWSILWRSARRSGHGMIRNIGLRPIIFSVNCYIATMLTMFVAFSLDLKSPGWAMTTVYLTSQPLSGAM